MPRHRPTHLPKYQRLLELVGESLQLVRLRRRLKTTQVAERAGISLSTLQHLEKGEANTSLGTLLQVLVALKRETDLGRLASDDQLGRKLMDIELSKRSG